MENKEGFSAICMKFGLRRFEGCVESYRSESWLKKYWWWLVTPPGTFQGLNVLSARWMC